MILNKKIYLDQNRFDYIVNKSLSFFPYSHLAAGHWKNLGAAFKNYGAAERIH